MLHLETNLVNTLL